MIRPAAIMQKPVSKNGSEDRSDGRELLPNGQPLPQDRGEPLQLLRRIAKTFSARGTSGENTTRFRFHHFAERFRERQSVARFSQHAAIRLDNLRRSSKPRCHDRQSRLHRLDEGNAEGFGAEVGLAMDIGRSEKVRHVVTLAEPLDALFDTKAPGYRL